jgi:hypothetical protein
MDTTRKKIWQGEGKKKYHLVKWSKVTCPKQKGGLGIKDLRKMNLGLLCKCGGNWKGRKVCGQK